MTEVCPHHDHLVKCVEFVKSDSRSRAKTYLGVALALLGTVGAGVSYAAYTSSQALHSVEVHKAESDATTRSVLATLSEIKADVKALRDRKD